jgi:hypothetical protein
VALITLHPGGQIKPVVKGWQAVNTAQQTSDCRHWFFT